MKLQLIHQFPNRRLDTNQHSAQDLWRLFFFGTLRHKTLVKMGNQIETIMVFILQNVKKLDLPAVECGLINKRIGLTMWMGQIARIQDNNE